MTRQRLGLVLIAALFIAVAIGALLAARGSNDQSRAGSSAPGPYRGSEPPPGIRAPDFALRSYRGPLVRMHDLRGMVVLVTFLDTHCTESCPIIAGILGRTLPRLSPAERKQVVTLAISVQPHIDTPASIRRFLRARHALGAVDFLIGSVRRLRPVWKRFHVVPAVDTGNADIHSADVRVSAVRASCCSASW